VPDDLPFPINSRAIYYLISNGYLDAPTITEAEIMDKSKAGQFTNPVAVIQMTYLRVPR